MNFPWLAKRLLRLVARRYAMTAPDFVVGDMSDPYLLRWYLLPRNRFLNAYLHEFWRSDDDRALHDHPWPSVSISLQGHYLEHEIKEGGIHKETFRQPGDIVFRSARRAHRIELLSGDRARTLFITGPRTRQWGFHCPHAGWVPWRAFVANTEDGNRVGKGCDQ